MKKQTVEKKFCGVDRVALEDDKRLQVLFLGAVKKGFVFDCEKDRLWYWTAAEHALRRGNPPQTAGHLFAWLVSGNHRDHASEADEARARARLRRKR